MYYLRTEAAFDSAHFLKGYNGKCANLHGHRWRVVVEINKEHLDVQGQTRGMVMDFGDVKDYVKELCDNMDHCFIYEEGSLREETLQALQLEGFKMINLPFIPTAENLSKYIYEELEKKSLPMHKVEVYETPNNCAIYQKD